MIKNPLTYEIMTPQSVGVPGTIFVLGKHSGRHALSQRCERLGFRLEGRELDHVYRQFLALADDTRTVEDSYIVEIVRAMRRGESSVDVRATHSSISSTAPEETLSATGTKGMFPHESEQQEDYLWGV